ncbi:MAG: 50S ribosomal protein L24e [Candidatus Heimdallarchaeota archaeon]|nr:50S ribosomal protein L24e [Candidatus Heimdallarchaeota archaeon]MBY8994561.1 50S ribosomal protein L24e [Candidatus Heimdallarchaeota archaeon]
MKEQTCAFCASGIEPGTGTMYVKNDGSILWFCSRKCRVSMVDFKRNPRKLKWTERYEQKILTGGRSRRRRKGR